MLKPICSVTGENSHLLSLETATFSQKQKIAAGINFRPDVRAHEVSKEEVKPLEEITVSSLTDLRELTTHVETPGRLAKLKEMIRTADRTTLVAAAVFMVAATGLAAVSLVMTSPMALAAVAVGVVIGGAVFHHQLKKTAEGNNEEDEMPPPPPPLSEEPVEASAAPVVRTTIPTRIPIFKPAQNMLQAESEQPSAPSLEEEDEIPPPPPLRPLPPLPSERVKASAAPVVTTTIPTRIPIFKPAQKMLQPESEQPSAPSLKEKNEIPLPSEEVKASPAPRKSVPIRTPIIFKPVQPQPENTIKTEVPLQWKDQMHEVRQQTIAVANAELREEEGKGESVASVAAEKKHVHFKETEEIRYYKKDKTNPK